MNKKIVPLLLALTLVAMIGVPQALAVSHDTPMKKIQKPQMITPTPTPMKKKQEQQMITPIPTPIITPVETPVTTPIETPVETPMVTPVETPVEIPTPPMPIPEFPTLVLPIAAIMGLIALLLYRRENR